MANIGAVISSIRNIMRQDRGISGDAQRLEQLGWMLFLKILDDKDQELELIRDNYVSVVPETFQWRNWATNPEGITGDELLVFIDSNSENNKGLFATLRNLTATNTSKRAELVQEVFEGNNNYMKSGYEMRKVINKLNEIDFNNSNDKHVFGTIYESILEELRDAGNKGEYYTPRAITKLMTMLTDPKLNEKVLDPACGTGGFLTAAIDHIRGKYVKNVEDEQILQKSITGWELKPVAYVLGLTNLILHEIDVPDYHYIDSLKKEYNTISNKDRVDVILANPPFGASIADGVETNFPASFRCKESADLFVILMIQLLKGKGRAAIVLPDGSITGEGIKARIREKLLAECNLHTIVRLPQSTFAPATVSTNLLFFEKGSPTTLIYLNVAQVIPLKRLETLCKDLFNLPICKRTIENILERATNKGEPVKASILKIVQKSAWVGSDETGKRVEGNRWWEWVWQSITATYYAIDKSRGYNVVEKHFGNDFQGTLLHDCLAAQNKTKAANGHQQCIPHIQRELQFLIGTFKHPWAFKLNRFLGAAQRARDQIWSDNFDDNLRKSIIANYEKRLESFLTPICANHDILKLQKRIKKHRESILRFMHSPDLPFHNNSSEQAIRMAKVKQKISGCFRSQRGAERQACLLSIIETAKKQKMNILSAIKALLSETLVFQLT